MRTKHGHVLRWMLLLDAAIVAAIGLAFWGSWPGPLRAIGIALPETQGDLTPWRAISMAGLFGGALVALASALVALALSRDRERLWLGAPVLIAGTAVLGFVAFAKVTAFGFPPAGYWLVIALVAPAGFLPIGLALDADADMLRSSEAVRLSGVAGQMERQRLAANLHDSVKQQVYSIQAYLAAADARWDTDGNAARLAVARARDGARDAIREMDALLDRLEADPVEMVGLVEALRRQCEALGFQTGAKVTTEFGPLPGSDRLDSFVTNALFRIAQEALANVARHARPTRVRLFAGTTGTAANAAFILQIHDDGSGFEPPEAGDPTAGMGLRNMRTRARDIGATLSITSGTGRGTVVEVTMPLRSRFAAWRPIAGRLVAGIGVPTLVLAAWSASWPEWSAYLRPFVIVGLAAVVLLAGWLAATAEWLRS